MILVYQVIYQEDTCWNFRIFLILKNTGGNTDGVKRSPAGSDRKVK